MTEDRYSKWYGGGQTNYATKADQAKVEAAITRGWVPLKLFLNAFAQLEGISFVAARGRYNRGRLCVRSKRFNSRVILVRPSRRKSFQLS